MFKHVNMEALPELDCETLPTGRTYITPEGNKYPSITTVLSLLSKDGILAWRKRVGEETANKITAQATKRGTNFHSLVEDYLRREKEFIEFDNVLQEGMFKAMQPVLDEVIPIALEAPLYSNVLQMAGRVDCVGIFNDQLSIIDFKTSAKFKEDYMAESWFIQMTAYAIMVEELTGQAIEEITALVAIEGHNSFQIFSADPLDYVDKLNDLRVRYKNIYGV